MGVYLQGCFGYIGLQAAGGGPVNGRRHARRLKEDEIWSPANWSTY